MCLISTTKSGAGEIPRIHNNTQGDSCPEIPAQYNPLTIISCQKGNICQINRALKKNLSTKSVFRHMACEPVQATESVSEESHPD